MVDDEKELVTATVSMLARELGPSQVRGATDPREVAKWIDAERPTALITDVRMPHVTGLELVTKLHERWGPVPVVVMTAFPTAQVDQDARAGRFAYLLKPFTFHTLRETLLRICHQPAPSAFSGAIAVSMLGEVVQLYGLANRSGVLRVLSPAGSGDIGFESGRVIDARTGPQSGVDAFNTILSWTSGSFNWFATPPVGRTINQGLAELLIDAYRLRDEQDAKRGGGAGASASSSTSSDDELDLALDSLVPTGSDNVQNNLRRLERVDGFLGAALYDLKAQSCLAALEREGLRAIETLVGGHAELVTAKQNTIGRLRLDDTIEDIVISLGQEYHLLRLCRRDPKLFFFLSLERSKANLAMARYVLSDVERDIVL